MKEYDGLGTQVEEREQRSYHKWELFYEMLSILLVSPLALNVQLRVTDELKLALERNVEEGRT